MPEKDGHPFEAVTLYDRVLINPPSLENCVYKMGKKIRKDYLECTKDAEIPLTVILIMNGALFFGSSLARYLSPVAEKHRKRRFSIKIGTVKSASYEGTARGEIRLSEHSDAELRDLVQNRHVLLIDDILDSGCTLKKMLELIKPFDPRDVRISVLLEKVGKNETDITPDYVGYQLIGNPFVVGFGLDWNGFYREEPSIRVVADPKKPASYSVVEKIGRILVSNKKSHKQNRR